MPSTVEQINAWNKWAADKTAEEIILWAKKGFGSGLVMTSSFGIQSAVLLRMVNTLIPHIPVIFIDTGYLPLETYRYVLELSGTLDLNLKIYASGISPKLMESFDPPWGKLLEKGEEGIDLFNRIRKVSPMRRALSELRVNALLAGIRAEQTEHRANLAHVTQGTKDGIYRVHPLLKWTAADVATYFGMYGLMQHPLKAQEELKLKRECGLHLPEYQI